MYKKWDANKLYSIIYSIHFDNYTTASSEQIECVQRQAAYIRVDENIQANNPHLTWSSKVHINEQRIKMGLSGLNINRK